MKDFKGKIAVVTGGGTGMGRELVRQLAAEGCHVAACDILEDNLEETLKLARAEAAKGVLVTGHPCDVADEAQVLAFKEKVAEEHQTNHINLLINNAGIGGGGSFLESSREEWERTFWICWFGVYYFTRAFMPMLRESTEGRIVNVASVDSLRATFAGKVPHTAYSTAKFAVRGFTEGLILDFRYNAPHLKASVVIPGGVSSPIAINTSRILGHPSPEDMSAEQLAKVRKRGEQLGRPGVSEMSDEELRATLSDQMHNFASQGLTPAQGAEIILNGVKADKWRILLGKDADAIDRAIRKYPLEAYDPDFNQKRIRPEYENAE